MSMSHVERMNRKTEIGKTAFELYLEGKCNDEALISYAEELGIKVKTLKGNYMTYYKNRIVEPKPTMEQLEKYGIYLSSRFSVPNTISPERLEFIESLLKVKYSKEAISVADTSGYSAGAIYQSIWEYIKANPDNKKEKVKLRKIEALLKAHQAGLHQKRLRESNSKYLEENKQKHIEVIKRIIEEFLIAETDALEDVIDRYQEEISYQIFSRYLDELATGSKEEQFLFERLAEKIAKDREYHEELAKKIIFGVKNGVIKNEAPDRFNILDFHRATKLSIRSFLKIMRSLLRGRIIARRDLEMVEAFFENFNGGYGVMTPEEALAHHYVYNNQVLADSEKISLINYLIEMRIPINKNTYCAAIEEYVKGTLNITPSRTV